MTIGSFFITYDSQGFYRVSIPNYDGGEVVSLDDAKAAIAAAVMAERERAEQAVIGIANDRGERDDQSLAYYNGYKDAVVLAIAAIRARNGAGK